MGFSDSICPNFLKLQLARVAASPIGYRLASGAMWSLVGAVISRGITLISIIMVARILGKIEFGELGIIQSSVGMFSVFAGFGLGTTATKYVAELRRKDPGLVGRIVALSSLISIAAGGIMAALLFVFSPWFASNVLKASHLSYALALSSPLLLLGAWAGAQHGALIGFEAFKPIAISNLISGVSSFPLLLIGAEIFGLSGAIVGLLLSSLLGCAINRYALTVEMRKVGVRATYSGCIKEWPILLNFSLPALLVGVMASPVTWVCSVMLVNSPSGYSEMGVFNAANQWLTVILFLPTIIGNVALPVMCERLGEKNPSAIRKILKVSMQITAVIVLPVAAVLCAFSSPIMSLYGREFSGSGLVLSYVALTGAVVAIQVSVSYVIAAYGRMWMGFFMNVGWGIAFILFSHMLVDEGAAGISLARLFAYVIHSAWTFGYAYLLLRSHDLPAGSDCEVSHAGKQVVV